MCYIVKKCLTGSMLSATEGDANSGAGLHKTTTVGGDLKGDFRGT